MNEPVSMLRQLLELAANGGLAVSGLLAPSADAATIEHSLGTIGPIGNLAVDEVSGPYPGRTSFTVTAVDRLWITVIRTDDRKLVEQVAVFARPELFPGTPGGFVVCVGGASSSGKSSLMTAMCEQAATPWTMFDERSIGITPMRFLIWPERSGPLVEGFFAAVGRFAESGNQVVLSCDAREGRGRFASIPGLYVHLHCPLDELIQREKSRQDRWAGLAEETFALTSASHEEYDLCLDSYANSPTQLAATVLDAVTRQQPSDTEHREHRV